MLVICTGGDTRLSTFLDMNHIVVIQIKQGADGSCIGCFVARNIIAVEDSRKPGNVHGENIEVSSCSSGDCRYKACSDGGNVEDEASH